MRDLSVAAKQQSSLELWDSQDRYELVVSDLMLAEASAGDAQAAAARRAWLTNLPILPIGTKAVRAQRTHLPNSNKCCQC
jgi:hypothetical protein